MLLPSSPASTPPPNLPPGAEAAEQVEVKTTWFEALLLSVISTDFYVEVLRSWRGFGLGYLGWILMLLSIPCAMKVHDLMGKEISAVRDKLLPQFPTLTIKNGKASTDVEQPYVIYEGGAGTTTNPIAVVDTTGGVTSLDGRPESVLITEDGLYMKVGEPSQTAPFPFVGDYVIDNKSINVLAGFMQAISGWLFYPMLVLRNYILWMLQAALLAGLSSLMMLDRRVGARFKDLLRLCIIACTPAIYLETLAFLLDIRWQYWNMVPAVVAVMYVTTALRVASERMNLEDGSRRAPGA